MQLQSTAGIIDIPLASMTALDVHAGRKSRVLRGLIIGAAVGAPLSGLALMQADEEGSDPGPGEYFLFGAVVGGAAFGAIGAVIGALVKTDRWEQIPLDQLRVSLTPQRDGQFGIGLSVAF